MGLTLLVASAGGHLAELYRLRHRLPGVCEIAWITTEHPHSRSLLAGENVLFLPHSPSRSIRATFRNARLTRAFLRSVRPDRVISNGASIAVPILVQTAWRRIPTYYIESAARLAAPSLTGRILSRVPRVRTCTQWPALASRRWRYVGSVFDDWQPDGDAEAQPIRRVVVTVGTESWPLRAQLERQVGRLPADAEVLWQAGSTPVDGLGVRAVVALAAGELDAAIATADLVIAHSGVGSALAAITAGKAPLLVPRRSARGEAVDDHQIQIGEHLERLGLAFCCEVDELDARHFAQAAARRVRRRCDVPPLQLG
jgi:UDP-N-acetylglucosamine transferase subunit ALG13